VAWARHNGISLILNMHVPPGGFQSNGAGDALWNEAGKQDRLVALWQAIARRYRGETAIAGYDLLNEPQSPCSRQQWVDLATRLHAAIRAVDPEHTIVVERTNSVGADWSNDADMNFFLLPDSNVLYEFHFYSPIEYTHQHTSWTGFGEAGPYPDASKLASGNLSWYGWSYLPGAPPAAPSGSSDWTYFESQPYRIDDPAIKVLAVVLLSELNAGTAYFDDVVVKEYDADGVLVGTVVQMDLESLDGWSFWTAGNTGTSGVSTTEAHSGQASLFISNTEHDANLTNTARRLVVVPGHSYSVGGWIKGVNVSSASRPDPRGTWTQNSRALIRLDYFSSDGPVLVRDKAALAAELDRYVAWGRAHGVPLYLGEFGVFRSCFEDGRGGLAWVADMLDLLVERQLSFTYHSYHEDAFGIFRSDPATTLPAPLHANLPLIDLFKAKLDAL
jgi:endoglucanase